MYRGSVYRVTVGILSIDPSHAVRASRTAMRAIRDGVPLDQRIVFIHIGV